MEKITLLDDFTLLKQHMAYLRTLRIDSLLHVQFVAVNGNVTVVTEYGVIASVTDIGGSKGTTESWSLP